MDTLISENLIQLRVDAKDWKDAITQAATPLVIAGKVEERYIQGIIDSMIEFGPYFVIIPHVALPHARPEMGALEDAIGITTLLNPVEFGSKGNDPVKYIFTLSARENDSHLSGLAKLANLVEDEAFFKLLDAASDAKEIIEYLNREE